MATEAQQWADAHMDELKDALNNADPRASEMLMALVGVRVPHRHSVVAEIHKFYDGEMDKAVETAMRLGGGFFQKVADGEYAEAYLHADNNNQRIIEEAYDVEFVRRQADDGYLADVVHERWTDELPSQGSD